MEAVPHPIVLERVFFTRSIVVSVPEHVPGNMALAIGPENKIDVVPIENESGRYQATMRTTLNSGADPSVPYVIDMECVGIFVANNTLTAEVAAGGVMITAHSILYGAIRESVSWITGRQPFGQLMLGLSVLQHPPSEKTE